MKTPTGPTAEELTAMSDEEFDDDPGHPEVAEEVRKTILEEVEDLAGSLMRVAKKTKMSETGILNIFSFIWQQNERAKQEAMAPQPTGQEMVDAIAREHAEKEENQTREADEEI